MQTLIDSRFSNLEVFREEARPWDLDFRLLEGGGFSSRVIQLVSSAAHIGYAKLDRKVDQAGSNPHGFRTFVIPERNCSPFWWRGHNVGDRNLLVFPTGGELRCVSESGFGVIVVSLSIDHLERLAERLGWPVIAEHEQVILPKAEQMTHLRFLANSVLRHRDSISCVQQLAEALLLVTTDSPSKGCYRPRGRDLAINRVLDYLRQTPEARTNLSALCRVANVSERTLQYAFMERYGISPITFSRRWKLNNARRILTTARPGERTVGGVSMSLGFNSHSLFTREYRNLFAELPSDTLANSGY